MSYISMTAPFRPIYSYAQYFNRGNIAEARTSVKDCLEHTYVLSSVRRSAGTASKRSKHQLHLLMFPRGRYLR
jgi:hypothetical protein